MTLHLLYLVRSLYVKAVTLRPRHSLSALNPPNATFLTQEDKTSDFRDNPYNDFLLLLRTPPLPPSSACLDEIMQFTNYLTTVNRISVLILFSLHAKLAGCAKKDKPHARTMICEIILSPGALVVIRRPSTPSTPPSRRRGPNVPPCRACASETKTTAATTTTTTNVPERRRVSIPTPIPRPRSTICSYRPSPGAPPSSNGDRHRLRTGNTTTTTTRTTTTKSASSTDHRERRR